MNKAIQEFYDDVIDRMSRVYYDELLYFSADIPEPLINFNDILLLKKGQKYISHTNMLFQKSISKLYSELIKLELKKDCSICSMDGGKGKGVYFRGGHHGIRVHFLGQEKFVNFPKVPWLNMKDGSSDCLDLYTVMIEKNEQGIRFIDHANRILQNNNVTTKEFVLLEDFTIERFGKDIWVQIHDTMKVIERDTKKYQWFGLINYYNSLTQVEQIQIIEKTIKSFDYRAALQKTKNVINQTDFDLLYRRFIELGKYRILLSSEDFASSFITSEWLYENLNSNDMLEKTFIVSGYVKSIEQLMSFLILHASGENDKIGILSSVGITEVDVHSDDFFKATLGNMQYYLKQYTNRHIFIRGISSSGINLMNEIIKEWINKERNGYFHKHNISTTEKVTDIRKKTYLLYFLLVGSIQMDQVEINRTSGQEVRTKGIPHSENRVMPVKQDLRIQRSETGENDPVTSLEKKESIGLQYELLKNNTYAVIGLGSCRDTILYIPNAINGKPVSTIKPSAIVRNKTITRIIIPDSVKAIGNSGISSCAALEQIELGNGLQTIGNNVLRDCSCLNSVHIPQNVTSIGESCFSGCIALAYITVDKKNMFFDSRNECNCVVETKTDTVRVVCNNSVFNKSIKKIGDYSCQSTNWETICLPIGLEEIGDNAFSNCNRLKEITIPDTVKRIGVNAFANCSNLKVVKLSSSLISIPDGCFKNCTSITDIIIPDKVTSIEKEAFKLCTALTSVVIPISVISIGNNVFKGCTKLMNLHYSGTNKQWAQINLGEYKNLHTIQVVCLSQS